MLLKDLLKKEINQASDVEIYQYRGKRHDIHTDFVDYIDKSVNDIDIDSFNDLEFELMDQERYNNTIMANCSDYMNFEDLYGDPESKVLVIVLPEYFNL